MDKNSMYLYLLKNDDLEAGRTFCKRKFSLADKENINKCHTITALQSPPRSIAIKSGSYALIHKEVYRCASLQMIFSLSLRNMKVVMEHKLKPTAKAQVFFIHSGRVFGIKRLSFGKI